SFKTRFETEPGTNPEELIGAALAGCYSMALSAGLGEAGHKAESIKTNAEVDFGIVDGGTKISTIRLHSVANVPGIDKDKFMEIAEATKTGCPVSQALKTVDIQLKAELT